MLIFPTLYTAWDMLYPAPFTAYSDASRLRAVLETILNFT